MKNKGKLYHKQANGSKIKDVVFMVVKFLSCIHEKLEAFMRSDHKQALEVIQYLAML